MNYTTQQIQSFGESLNTFNYYLISALTDKFEFKTMSTFQVYGVVIVVIAILTVIVEYYKRNKKKSNSIHEDYMIRKAELLDFDDINEICANIYYGTDYVNCGWHRFIKDPSYHIYVAVYKQLNKVVSVSFIKVHDNGQKGTILGSRTHINHRRKGIIKSMTTYMQQEVVRMYPTLIAWESVVISSNNTSMRLQEKRGFILTDVEYKVVAVTKLDLEDNKSPHIVMKSKEFQQRLTDLESNEKRYGLEFIEDGAEILRLLVDEYGLRWISYDWEIYRIDDKGCREEMVKFLQRELDEKRLYCVVNKDKSLICLVNVDERNVVQLHFYHMSDLIVDELLGMVRELFMQWEQEISGVFGQTSHFRIFVDVKYVESLKDRKLDKLLDGSESMCVCNSNSNYYG